jgi:hypothetical protein
VRKAISQIPKGNDYIILDRCAGTGNLEEFLTDKNVDDITIAELDKYLSNDFKINYLKDKANIITTFYSDKNFNNITLGELEKYKTKINIHNYLFDNELSHTIVNTYELKEWIVLNERIGNKVKMIIPPYEDVSEKKSLVNGGDALSQEFILGNKSTLYNLSNEYFEAINELNDYIKKPKINVILFENPPYRDENSMDGNNKRNKDKSFIRKIMAEEFKDKSNDYKDLANQFIWSGYKYYLKKADDAYVIFSPIKYWKSTKISNKKFIDGFIFNREHFHATKSVISCILWKNIDNNINKLTLKAFDISINEELDFVKDIEIIKVNKQLSERR